MSTRPSPIVRDIAHAPDPFPTLEQLDLLADGEVKGSTGLDRLREVRRLHQRGRPPGSPNKRNGRLRDYYLSQFDHPLMVLGKMLAMPLDAMMRLMIELQGGDKKHAPLRAIDVLRFRKELADTILPYIEGKQPLSVEVAHRKDLTILVPGLNAPGDNVVALDRLAELIEKFGMAAFDPETFELIGEGQQTEVAEFDDVGDVGDGDAVPDNADGLS